MGSLMLSSMMPKKSPDAPTLKEMGLEMSMHASALSDALPLPETSPVTVALRSTTRAASRLTKTLAELLKALIPKPSYYVVSEDDFLRRRDRILPEE